MISANPDTFTEGGSLLDDFDGKVLEAGTCLFDYNGTIAEGVPALRLVIGHGEGFAEVVIEHYTAGDVKNFVPSMGEGETFESSYGLPAGAAEGTTRTMGMGFDQVGDKGFLNKSTKTGMLIAAFVNAGLEGAVLDTGNYYAALTGKLAHWMRRTLPERTGGKALTQDPAKAGKKKFPEQILEPVELKEQAAAAAKPKPAATAAAKKPAPATAAKPAAAQATATPAAETNGASVPEAEYDDKIVEIILKKLTEEGGSGTIKKRDLVQLLYGSIKTDPKFRSAATKRAVSPDFLAAGPWSVEGDVLSVNG